MLQKGERLEELGADVRVLTSKSHTFGLDAIVLADFSSPPSGVKAADFGTGCGIIPLLWCVEQQNLKIDAVEIQFAAASLAQKSVTLSGLDGTVNIINDDFLTCPLLQKNSYDLIVCNPPYKKAGTGRLSESPEGKIARHETVTTLKDIVLRASSLLKNGGKFCLCHRPERMPELFGLLSRTALEPKRLRLVQHNKAAAPSILLLESRKNAKSGLKVEPVLLTDSDEMTNIYECFAQKRHET